MEKEGERVRKRTEKEKGRVREWEEEDCRSDGWRARETERKGIWQPRRRAVKKPCILRKPLVSLSVFE